ncbi:MAG: erythromycin esterase family protein, partial [Bdellovibrionota bacterium]
MNDSEIIKLIQLEARKHETVRETVNDICSRAKNSKVVLLGESTHGTSEFYDLRAEITMRLIRDHDFNLVALEADWPDVERVNSYVHMRDQSWDVFHRFPEWMWRNHSFSGFLKELRRYNASERHPSASVLGLDIYSLSTSLRAVNAFLNQHDPGGAEVAKRALKCLNPWQRDLSRYGHGVVKGYIEGCEDSVLELLQVMHDERLKTSAHSNRELVSALQNARIVKNAEEYYRAMFRSSIDSWNLRDQHMFETLTTLMNYYGPQSKTVVWAHNSHLGDARATQMGALGELNLGQLCR